MIVSSDEYWRPGQRSTGIGGWIGERFPGHNAVSAMLKASFDDIAAEPLPRRIVELLGQLDARLADEPATTAAETPELSVRREQIGRTHVPT